MARIARFIAPGLPHHVTQRGNRRERVFFTDEDYALYHGLLASQCRKQGVACWAYCLMPNHVHLILVPDRPESLARALGETHRRYSTAINGRLGVTGHLFQARFGSAAMDEEHLMAAARYVALNPVRARLVERAEDWRWSSVGAHLAGPRRRPGERRAADRALRALRRSDRDGAARRGFVRTAGRARRLAARSARRLSWISVAAAVGRDPRPKRRGPKPKVKGLGVE